MSNRGGGNNDWVPIAAGVVVGAGLLALIYKMFFTGCRKNVNTPFNQQQNIPYKCTCKKGGRDSNSSATEIEKRDKEAKKKSSSATNKKEAKTSHSAQTDPSGFDFGAAFGRFRSMFDGVGPWIPYIGGSAILLMLLGLLSKNVDKPLSMFEFEFEDKPSSPWTAPSAPAAPWTAPSAPASPLPEDSCQTKCAFRINKDRIKWPF